MNNTLDETLARVAEEVLQSLAFVLPAFEGEEEATQPPSDESWITGRISFTGPFDGSLILRLSNALLPEIGANMLGLDFGESCSPEQQMDAFTELLNVICGNLLPALAGQQAVFNVGAAELIADGRAPEAVAGRPLLAVARLHMEGGWAELAFFAPERIAAGTEATA